MAGTVGRGFTSLVDNLPDSCGRIKLILLAVRHESLEIPGIAFNGDQILW